MALQTGNVAFVNSTSSFNVTVFAGYKLPKNFYYFSGNSTITPAGNTVIRDSNNYTKKSKRLDNYGGIVTIQTKPITFIWG